MSLFHETFASKVTLLLQLDHGCAFLVNFATDVISFRAGACFKDAQGRKPCSFECEPIQLPLMILTSKFDRVCLNFEGVLLLNQTRVTSTARFKDFSFILQHLRAERLCRTNNSSTSQKTTVTRLMTKPQQSHGVRMSNSTLEPTNSAKVTSATTR